MAAVVLPSFDFNYEPFNTYLRLGYLIHQAENAGYSRNKFVIYTGSPTSIFQGDRLEDIPVLHRTDPRDFLMLQLVLNLAGANAYLIVPHNPN